MAGGYDGVVRVVDILEKEVRTTMQLLGVRSVDELSRTQVRLREGG
jgi:L-lactate dehydrogenase (cytochrome)